jgi:hypothetical protein
VEQVAEQPAVRQAPGIDGLGEAQCRPPAGGVRGEERVPGHTAHDRRERPPRLGVGRDHLVADRARGDLDVIPGHHVGGDKLCEPLQRSTTHIGLRPGLQQRPGEPARGAHIGVGEPGHG